MQNGPTVVLEDVWKSYGRVMAARGVSLEVPAGSVFGFLGPNGAGKTTTIRILLGLQSADRGSIFVLGMPMPSQRIAILRRVGAIVDAPCSYPHLTARENLEIHRLLLEASKADVDRVLEIVGLAPAANRLVRTYSLGMRQRLGIAQALLGRPELLVLDEPTNGLDPAGIQEIRTLIRSLPAAHGVTVFLSSHLLAEVEQVATHVAILSNGKVLSTGTLEALHQRNQPRLVVAVDQPDRAVALLRSLDVPAVREENRLTLLGAASQRAAWVNRVLVEEGVEVAHLSVERPTLESIFLDLTSDETAKG